jgi:hypothetical protein
VAAGHLLQIGGGAVVESAFELLSLALPPGYGGSGTLSVLGVTG